MTEVPQNLLLTTGSKKASSQDSDLPNRNTTASSFENTGILCGIARELNPLAVSSNWDEPALRSW